MFRVLSNLIQKLIDSVGVLLNFVMSVFPDSPFSYLQNSQFSELVSKINFFIPIYEFMAILQSWLVAIAVYYLYAVFARWLKAIQ